MKKQILKIALAITIGIFVSCEVQEDKNINTELKTTQNLNNEIGVRFANSFYNIGNNLKTSSREKTTSIFSTKNLSDNNKLLRGEETTSEGVLFTNETTGESFSMINIVLSDDKMSFTFDMIKDNLEIKGLIFESNIALPDTPDMTNNISGKKDCCDWDGWIDSALDSIDNAVDVIGGAITNAINAVGEALTDLADSIGQTIVLSDCPPGTRPIAHSNGGYECKPY